MMKLREPGSVVVQMVFPIVYAIVGLYITRFVAIFLNLTKFSIVIEKKPIFPKYKSGCISLTTKSIKTCNICTIAKPY